MMSNPIPQSYEEWQHCITVECGIPLTPAFIAKRLTVWRNEEAQETKRFRHLYGDAHWRAVIGRFEQAEREVGSTTS